MADIMACQAWTSNAEMMADAAKLGYIHGRILDPTYGLGVFWRRVDRERLVAADIDPVKGACAGLRCDYRALPFPDGTFDTVVFDPPYVAPGGRKTTSVPEFWERYGMADTPSNPRGLYEYNNEGFYEAERVASSGAHILYKSQDYIWGGKLNAVTHWIITEAETLLDLEYIDRLELLTSPRPQPKGRRQLHARRNLSTLLVFRKP